MPYLQFQSAHRISAVCRPSGSTSATIPFATGTLRPLSRGRRGWNRGVGVGGRLSPCPAAPAATARRPPGDAPPSSPPSPTRSLEYVTVIVGSEYLGSPIRCSGATGPVVLSRRYSAPLW